MKELQYLVVIEVQSDEPLGVSGLKIYAIYITMASWFVVHQYLHMVFHPSWKFAKRLSHKLKYTVRYTLIIG